MKALLLKLGAGICTKFYKCSCIFFLFICIFCMSSCAQDGRLYLGVSISNESVQHIEMLSVKGFSDGYITDCIDRCTLEKGSIDMPPGYSLGFAGHTENGLEVNWPIEITYRISGRKDTKIAKVESASNGSSSKRYFNERINLTYKNDTCFFELEASDNHAAAESLPPLHEASKHGNIDTVRTLLAQGVDINATDKFGQTPLHKAVLFGHTEIIKLLIGKGAETNARDNDGQTPLHGAAENGYTDIARLLLDNGANFNTPKRVVTPLHGAAENGHAEIVKLLLDKGAETNARDDDGQTPLHKAAIFGYTEIAKLLLDKGAKTNVRDDCGDRLCTGRLKTVTPILLGFC